MRSKLDNNRISKLIDLICILFTTMFFTFTILFSYMGLDEKSTNAFFILILMVGVIIGYFTNITVSIIYSITFIFVYASINIYLNITRGIPVGGEIYFWMMEVPLFSIIFAYFGGLIKNIQEENTNLKEENAEYVLIDRETGLMTSKTFFKELQVFMKISKRYSIEVYLILVKVKYENEVLRILGEAKYNKMLGEISKAINSILREEDRKYILRDVNMFGIILLSNRNGGDYVKDRLKESISNINFEGDALINKIQLETQVGLTHHRPSDEKSPYEIFKMAEKDLEYDV